MRFPRVAIASALIAGMGFVATRAAAQETSPSRPAPWLPYVVSGAVIFGSSWAASYAVWLNSEVRQVVQCNGAMATAQAHQADANWSGLGYELNAIAVCGSRPVEQYLWVPVAGPWVTLAHGQLDGASQTLLVADGVAQGAGLALMAYGLLRRVAAPVASEGTEVPPLLVQPGVGTSAAGLTVIGRF